MCRAAFDCASLLVVGIEGIQNLLPGGGGEQGDHHNGQQGAGKGGQQLVNVPDAAHGTDQELPQEDHHAAYHQAGHNALAVAALPEQGAEHGRPEGGAKAGPGEGNDLEHIAVGVGGQENGDHRDTDHGQPGDAHVLLFGELDAQHILHDILRKGGGGGQQLGVGGGHGGGQDTGQDAAGYNGGENAVAGQQVGQADNHRLCGAALQEGDAAGGGYGVAHDADEHRHPHGDHHPHRGDAAGELQLVFIPDGHKAHQNVGHSKVAQAPGHHGDDADDAIGLSAVGGCIIGLAEAEVAGQGFGVFQNSIHTASLHDAKGHNNGQSDGHNDGLNEVHGGHGAEAAHRGVADDDNGAHHHGGHVVPAKEAAEQLSDGSKAGGYIRDKENEDDESGDAHDHGLLFSVALGDKAGNGDGIQLYAIAAQPPGHQQEVQVGTEGQADGRPAGVRHAAEIGKARNAHEQIAAHVRGLSAHGGDQRAHATPAQIEALGALFGAAADHNAGENDKAQVQNNSTHDAKLGSGHTFSPY